MRYDNRVAESGTRPSAYEREFARARFREARRRTLDFELSAEPWVPGPTPRPTAAR